ncbi:myomegalin isoform X4 [Carcharodon carcharias]|uniref:myomegalin isoform X4 n=1 Tax=Carcharodon carcharias TaxID=13397 RepID=UPI001B7DBDE4|nr:myomegalin isoform X4 [Carcharodon carcharias]
MQSTPCWKMKEVCRICARELCGNQRRWIFHTASKLNLQVILSHILGKEVSRDGKAEFACSKCAFMLDRIYRFDTVIARIEALSIERLQKLLVEKDRIKHCIASLFRKNNEEPSNDSKGEDIVADGSNLPDVRYHALLQDDFVYSGFESWTEQGEEAMETHSCQTSETSSYKSRKCRSCSALRVTDADYEAVCRVPRKLAKTVSGDPSIRCGSNVVGSITAEEGVTMPVIHETVSIGQCESRTSVYADSLDKMSPASSVESLGAVVEPSAPIREVAQVEKSAKDDKSPKSDFSDGQATYPLLHSQKLDFVLNLVKNVEYRPVSSPKGSKLPIPLRPTPLGSQSSGSLGDGISRSDLQNNGHEFAGRYIEPPRMHLNFDDMADLDDLLQDMLDEYIPICTQNLIEEQQQQLNQYESAAGQCVTELQKAQVQVHGLQGRIQETESANKMLQENLREMESELRAMRYTAQKQDRTQLELKEALENKEKEVEELYRVIDGQNETQAKLREMLHRSQLEDLKRCASCQSISGQPVPPHAQQQAELLELQSTSFSNQLELQRVQRLIRQKEYELTKDRRRKELIESELEEVHQQKEATIKHNQELLNTLQQVRQELLEKEQHYQALEREHQREVHVQGENIQCLKERLQDKEHFLQQYIELFECQENGEQNGEERDALVDKLRERIKERDKALEHAIDEKFSTLEEKESEIQQLHLALREKERDLERFRCIFSNNEETINSLESLMKGKDLELEQITMAYKNLQWLKQEMEEKHAHSLKEKDTVSSQLQAALHNSNKELEDLTVVLMNKVSTGSDEVMEQLRWRLQLKERMLQEALTDRSILTADHEQEVAELLQTINSHDQQMKDAAKRLMHTLAEKNHELQTLRHQLAEKNREAENFTKQHVFLLEVPTEVARLKELLQEKDRIIHELVQDGHSKNEPSLQPEKMEASEPIDIQQNANEKEVVQTAIDGDDAMTDSEQEDIRQVELEQIKEELQLVLRKEKETTLELTTLQSVLANQEREIQRQIAEIEVLSSNIRVKEECIKDLQMQLVQPCEFPEVERLTQELLVLREQVAKMQSSTQKNVGKKHHQLICALEEQIQEQSRLSEALRSERQLYISLVKFHSQTDSSSREDSLQAELLAVQALRRQLEETLKRSQEHISRLERESEMPADSGERHRENAADDGSTQCADSAHHNVLKEHLTLVEQNHQTAESLGELQKFNIEMHELMEQKKLVEEELKELKAQIEASEYTSVTQMRSALLNLSLKNALKKEGVGDDLTLQAWSKEGKENLNVWGQCEEIRKLTVKLQNSETIISLLKEQLELNSSQIGEGRFNPELIVNMAKEIERLKSELSLSQTQHSSRTGVHVRDRGTKRARPYSLDLGTLLSQGNEETPSAIDAVQQVTLQGVSPWQHADASLGQQSRLRQQSNQLQTELAEYRQQNKELQEKLVVTEATVKAQDNQLQQYKDLLSESSVEQDSKQVQVDLQDLGYETCGRSENEAEREEASSPEYSEADLHLYPCYKENMIQRHSSLEKPGSSTSNPAFSLPLSIKSCLRKGLTFKNGGKSNDVAMLQQHVNELKEQLTESDKIIRSLQSRIRSFSTTSDYASSLERPHDAALGDIFEALQFDELYDDDVWQSDGGDHCQATTQSNMEIKKLIHRVTMLESQLMSAKMTAPSSKGVSWSGKYDCLIQAQARELSHLRQKMREGRGICHILKQHLGDTTKSFEELLRANDIDYYMGQSFRDQLAQGSQLAERITHKLTGRDPLNISDKGDQELLVVSARNLEREIILLRKQMEKERSLLHGQLRNLRQQQQILAASTREELDKLSKELQQKNKLIASLSCKLQSRADTPSSSHVLSDSEQSDRASFVSEEQKSTNDDLEVYHYEVDSSSEYSHNGQQNAELETQTTADDQSHCENPSQHSSASSCENQPKGSVSISPLQQPCTDTVKSEKGLYSSSVPPSTNASHASYCADFPCQFRSLPFGPAYPTASTFSLAEVQQELHMLQRQLGESMTFSGTGTGMSSHLEQVGCASQSNNALHQQLSNTNNLQEVLRTTNSYLDNNALWETTHRPVRINTLGDVSSGSSGYQSGTNMAGAEMLEEHLREIRTMRQRLEESIHTNNRLREQLEMRLAAAAKENAVAPTNIYIQGLETMTQLSQENRMLRDEILTLQAQLTQVPREQAKEIEQLRESLLTTRARYKLLETELDQWREENNNLQAEVRDRQEEALQLREEQQCSQNKSNRLLQEITMLQQQLNESHQLLHSLQSEIQVYERLYGKKKPFQVYSGNVQHHGGGSCAFDISDFLSQIRGLRIQLEHCIHTNGCLRKQLKEKMDEHRPSSLNINHLTSSSSEHNNSKQVFQDCVPSPPVRDTGLFSPFQLHPKTTSSMEDFNMEDTSHRHDGYLSDSMSQISCSVIDDAIAKKNGYHVVGHINDYNALQQQIMEGRILVQRMESIVQSCVNAAFLEIDGSKDLDHQTVKQLFSNTNTLRQILDETCSLLKMFWRADLPNPDSAMQNNQKEQSMKEEICRLRNKITEQESLLQNAISRLKATNQVKEGMEQFIVNQLTRTHDVLKKARSNLEPKSHLAFAFYNRPGKLSKDLLHEPITSEISKLGYSCPRSWNFMNPIYPEAEARSLGQSSLSGKNERFGPNLV